MSDARYRIGTLARLTGLTTHAIRAWERRYRAHTPARAAGGARLYTDEDVTRLRLVKRLLERGYTISAIAGLEVPELSELLTPGSGTAAAGVSAAERRALVVIDELLEALSNLNLSAAEHVLLRASNDFSPRQLVTAVLAPALEQVGARWASGDLCTASEHAASALLRTQLGALLSAQAVDPAKSAVVCTTLEGELHEFGALLVAVLIAMRGRRAVYLGANLPGEQIVEAARLSRASAVALSIVNLAPADAEREIVALCRALPGKVELLLGGRGVPSAQQLPARARVLSTLGDLERWLDTASN